MNDEENCVPSPEVMTWVGSLNNETELLMRSIRETPIWAVPPLPTSTEEYLRIIQSHAPIRENRMGFHPSTGMIGFYPPHDPVEISVSTPQAPLQDPMEVIRGNTAFYKKLMSICVQYQLNLCFNYFPERIEYPIDIRISQYSGSLFYSSFSTNYQNEKVELERIHETIRQRQDNV